MYCRNCGREINNTNDICTGCGFYGSYGSKYCQNCGKEVLPNQAMCVNCGCILNKSNQDPQTANNTVKETPYVKYKETVRKIHIFSFLMQVSTILLVLCLLFLPIYKTSFVPSLSDINSLYELEEAFDRGQLERNFSLFDDIKIIIKGIASPANSERERLSKLYTFTTGIFPIFEMISGVSLLCITGASLTKAMSGMQDIEKSTLLTYNEMLKTGTKEKKDGWFKKQTVFSVVSFVIFDIIFSKIDSSILDSAPFKVVQRNMYNLSGVSMAVVIPAILLVCYIVSNHQKKSLSEKMLLDITKEEYNR